MLVVATARRWSNIQSGMTQFSQTMYRQGMFDGFTVSASQLQAENGESGWLVDAWSSEENWSYWFSGGHFYLVAIHHADPSHSGRNTMQVGEPAGNVLPDLERAIREAIAKWRREYPADAMESASLKGQL